ncbi:hypothetical protein CWR43_06090 [Rhizobium sullae]|uniref:Uncharacterized protein n=1 Tax=Rhizobium sullae TaxID=50338 RepID=A0A2N0DEG5_RHISU|nr:hypothetical protein CWR43_06090 [Rhizobium sullae]
MLFTQPLVAWPHQRILELDLRWLLSFQRTASLRRATRGVEGLAIRVRRRRISCIPRWFLAFIGPRRRTLRSGTTDGLCFGIALFGRSGNFLNQKLGTRVFNKKN